MGRYFNSIEKILQSMTAADVMSWNLVVTRAATDVMSWNLAVTICAVDVTSSDLHLALCYFDMTSLDVNVMLFDIAHAQTFWDLAVVLSLLCELL